MTYESEEADVEGAAEDTEVEEELSASINIGSGWGLHVTYEVDEADVEGAAEDTEELAEELSTSVSYESIPEDSKF